MAVTLVLDNVGKLARGEVHLAGVHLTIAPGSFHVILGNTGAGKTSLLRVIAGLDRPTSGRILQGGADITRTSVQKRSVAMVYQQFINYPSLTVRENIASPMRRQKRPAQELDARVRELAALLHLEHLLERLPGELSGGQQQRVAIARALAKSADLLLLDEPLINLDYKLREELREELRTIFATQGTTVLYTTTDPAEALELGGHIILMHMGRVVQHGPALDVFHRPATTTAARVMSDPPMNLVDVTVKDGAALLGAGDSDKDDGADELRIPLPGELASLAEGAYCLGIRASDLTLVPPQSLPGAAADEIRPVAVRARVELSEISGSETFVYLRRGRASFVVQEQGVLHHELGEELTFYLSPRKLFVFERGDAEIADPATRAGLGQGGRLLHGYGPARGNGIPEVHGRHSAASDSHG